MSRCAVGFWKTAAWCSVSWLRSPTALRDIFRHATDCCPLWAQGVLVAQAPARSGALITATHALEQGRELFTIPASIYDAAFAGNLQLLRDGVMAAITPEDIARHYLARFSMAIHLESIRGKPSARNLPPKNVFLSYRGKNAARIHPTRHIRSPNSHRKTGRRMNLNGLMLLP